MFGSGYLANAGIIPVLIGRDGLVLVDELAHACLFAGAQLSRGTGDDISPQRRRPCARIAGTRIAPSTTTR